MCGQRAESILYNDEYYAMATLPLASYLKSLKEPFNFESPDTGLQRGYEGSWEIRDNLLLLVELDVYVSGYRKVDIQSLFPGEETVFANWYTGKIRLPLGKRIFDSYDVFSSICVYDLLLEIENGHLIGTETINTTKKGIERRLEQIELEKDSPF